MSVDNAKLETAFGSCGWGSCRSSCCEETQEPELDPQHKQAEIAARVELALAHKMVTDEMIASLKKAEIPRLDVVRETDESGTRIVIRVSKK